MRSARARLLASSFADSSFAMLSLSPPVVAQIQRRSFATRPGCAARRMLRGRELPKILTERGAAHLSCLQEARAAFCRWRDEVSDLFRMLSTVCSGAQSEVIRAI